ncbi:hypothetical protein [Luteolibacter sp. Populi]|uniref:hypothetical protein n=1 Tax=Luteolibacter sp. Populi TaxID=3230487 RepID=UPI003466786B
MKKNDNGKGCMMNHNHEYERIEDQGESLESVTSVEVEKGLGANIDPDLSIGRGSPFAVWAIRGNLLNELVSTGGRPGRREASTVKKIPLTKSEWSALDTITELIKGSGVKASASQVAGVLLRQSMTEVLLQLERVSPMVKMDAQALQLIPDDVLEGRVEQILAAAASAEAHLEQLRPVALELLRRMRAGKGAEAL